jgi:cytidylate kinase
MNVITITREYGAGGGEVAGKLAEILGWELLDRELLHQAAEVEHVPDAELNRLDEKAITMADRFRPHPPHQKYLHGLTEAARQAAQRGNVVLVGRGARHLLGETPNVFHLRLVAPRDWRAQRMARLEGWSLDQARARRLEMDRTRELYARYFFGDAAVQPAQYDLVVNTARVPLEDVACVVAAMVRPAPAEAISPSAANRVLTLSRELGAGETGFATALAERLAMRLYDREFLEQEMVRLGVPEAEIEKIDERPAGIFQRFRPGSIYQRCFEALGQLMHELADRGEVILVGRGGSRILRDNPRAFHVRVIAPLPVRLRRVMEYRWVRENVAKKLIAESDAQRRSFFESYFGVDWANPLEYHITANSGRLGPAAVELVSFAAERHWSRTE